MSKPSRKQLVVAGIVAAILCAGLNGVAFLHAWAMTHFAASGVQTPPPEKLSLAGKIRVLLFGVTLPRPQCRSTPADFGMPFQTIRIPSADGMTIEAWSVRHEESSALVVLFHGYGASKDSLLEAGRQFYGMGHDLLLVDFYGSGGSSGNSTSIGYHEARDVAAAFRAVTQDSPAKRVILYGQSMGAVAVLRAVVVFELEPQTIILECPFDSLLGTVARRFDAMKLPSFPLAHLLVFWGGAQHGFVGFGHEPVSYAPQVRCPTLLMSGDLDPRVTIRDSQRLFDSLAGSKQFKLFNGAGHESFVVLKRDEWVECVRAFLDDAAAGTQLHPPASRP